MKFNKYNAFYRNDKLQITDTTVLGEKEDIKEFLRYQLANLCMSLSSINYEEFICYSHNLIKAIEEVMKNEEDIIEVSINDNDNLIVQGKDLRICTECGKVMKNGYCIENGLEYYCSDKCLHKHYKQEEYDELYDNGNGDSYWTSWEH